MRYVVITAEYGHRTRVVGLLTDPAEDYLIGWMQVHLNLIEPGYPRPACFYTAELRDDDPPHTGAHNSMTWVINHPADAPWGGAVVPV